MDGVKPRLVNQPNSHSWNPIHQKYFEELKKNKPYPPQKEQKEKKQ